LSVAGSTQFLLIVIICFPVIPKAQASQIGFEDNYILFFITKHIIAEARKLDSSPVIKIVRLRPESDADIPLPRYMTPHSAGMDICAAITDDVRLNQGQIAMMATGFAIELPSGYEAQIRPRSGLAVKHGIGLINSPGTIDADYRGEVMIAVINLGQKPYIFRRGERIAQMVINKVYQLGLEEVDRLDETERGTGGFGHTGK
jgi:dUTP pyrophosphatase